jgi:hypothetical protein
MCGVTSYLTNCGDMDYRLVRLMALSLDQSWNRELRGSPYRLRFELGQGDTYLANFSCAYDRARALARAAIGASPPTAIIAARPNAKNPAVAMPVQDGEFGRLQAMGVHTTPFVAAWRGPSHPLSSTADAEVWQHRALEVSWTEADILLWSNIGQEIGVRPVAPVISSLVDVDREVMAYAYDDRGMDIVAVSASEIASLYVQFDAWLLDHDRDRMAAVFGKH